MRIMPAIAFLCCLAASCDNPDKQLPTPDAGVADQWQSLIGTEWTANPGGDTYLCVTKTISETMYISDFRAASPLGTHHTVLTIGDPIGPDDTKPCNGFVNQPNMIYGSGIGTNPVAMPEGVAMKVEAGQQLLLNLHLFNTTDSDLSGASSIEIKTMDESEVVEEGESVLAGKTFGLQVPNGESTQLGHCTMNGDVTIHAVAPHMHQLGTHMKVVAETANGEVTVHDDSYSFEDQAIYVLDEPLKLAQGERIRVYCTYDNPGPSVGFGESSDDEMCFIGLMRYPAFGGSAGGTPVCDDDLL